MNAAACLVLERTGSKSEQETDGLEGKIQEGRKEAPCPGDLYEVS